MSETSELSLEEVNTWKVDALKLFCRKRNLKTSGAKAELVARVFATSEMGIQVQASAKELMCITESERAKLLFTPEGSKLPDPLGLKDGWIDEKDGLTSWPPIFLSDITKYLMADHPGKDIKLHERVMNEYKEGKAYRLFDSGFLKEVFYHELENMDFCFLKAKCTHSMKVGDTPHTSWICSRKNGEIISAYCTCTAGMSGSCIHVMALLFRIEAANRNGMTNPACTSKECVWNVPIGNKTVIKPSRICDMEWKASKLNKETTRPAIDSRRKLFNSHEELKPLTPKGKRKSFYNNLKDLLPESAFIKLATAEFEEPCSTSVTIEINTEVPECVMPKSSKKDLSADDIHLIEQGTIGQSENEAWHDYRKGRLTASNFYRVYTKVETLKTKGGDAQELVDTIQGKSNGPSEHLPALKYGRNMEKVAKDKYVKLFQREHKDAKFRECGLFIDESDQFIGASPDLLVECSCCGLGVLEVKCPYSIVNDLPSEDNLSYLVKINGKIVLKEKHAYFAQIQGQMAVTKRTWCHFLVYTQKGYHLELIKFNNDYWEKIKQNLIWFYNKYLSE
ncbi:uncharacterized protein [Pocillopora verrucosa]|uniref:uncharacterized protein n=1 Tax=Pocillopora verrucosa TaxID=203993 RepID=UPI00333E4652